LIFLGKYDSTNDRFLAVNHEKVSFNKKDALAIAAYALCPPLAIIPVASRLLDIAPISKEEKNAVSEALGAMTGSMPLISRQGDFERLAFKTCFYEMIIRNLYQVKSKNNPQASTITLRVSLTDAKYGCVKQFSIEGQSYDVKVPPGSKNNTILRLKGVGSNGADILAFSSNP